jgi:hypothetical protein
VKLQYPKCIAVSLESESLLWDEDNKQTLVRDSEDEIRFEVLKRLKHEAETSGIYERNCTLIYDELLSREFNSLSELELAMIREDYDSSQERFTKVIICTLYMGSEQ